MINQIPVIFKINYLASGIKCKKLILTTLNGEFLQGVPPIEVYRAPIENEVGWPAFATEKGCS